MLTHDKGVITANRFRIDFSFLNVTMDYVDWNKIGRHVETPFFTAQNRKRGSGNLVFSKYRLNR